ncbi:ABC transporter permease [Candidatus Solirubrobacter pratensis]|uniref:ABC transporter permease n=1 Tax=Candidatus Solirubrobacter pratensis TaxID=1298857 RepID=UPI000429D431|nr:FtsX-like permease family protein [Candidatus Solirubrobacter pratensis]
MTALALRGLLARRRRLAGTFLAVFLGVSFLSGALVLGSTLARNFDSLFAEANAGTDAAVRSAAGVSSVDGTDRGPIDAALLGRVRAAPGVEAAEAVVSGYGALLGADGKAVGGNGPPRLAGNWIATPQLNAYKLVEGRAPRAAGEVVINRGAADAGGLKLSDTTTLQTPAPTRVRIVGIATFGSADGLGQSTFVALTTAQAQQLVLHRADRISTIRVAAEPGVSQSELVRRLRAVLPKGVDVVTGAQLSAEDSDQISGEFLDMLRAFLIVFAAIALLVATFSIHNTLSIVAAQRTRESALLRALGVSRGQVARLLATEALAVGATASVAGILGGLGMATGLKAMFDAFGGALPDGGLVVTPVTVIVSLGVGTLVTLVAGLSPARRAGRVPPVAALRETAAEAHGSSLAGSLAGLAGRPLRGVTGAIARDNARRNPRRTLNTASALAVGVAVVTLATVFVTSLKASVQDSVTESFAGDLAVAPTGWGGPGGGLDPALARRIGALPQVERAVGLGVGSAHVADDDVTVSIADLRALSAVTDLGGDPLAGDLAVSRKVADEHGWRAGSRVRVRFLDGSAPVMRIGAVYENRRLPGDYLLSRAAWSPHAGQDLDRAVYVVLHPGARGGQAAVARLAGDASVRTKPQYAEAAAGGLNVLLGLVYVMLLIAIAIALMGIGNTLALSVHERTRELGMLRAVGATRGQVRAIVRGESLIVAALGTAAGLLAGFALGALLVRIASVDAFAVGPTRLLAVAIVGVLSGALAALRPARRAARLEIPRALAAL